MRTTRPSWAETGACALVLALVALAAFGPHVADAGFLQDNWDLQSQSRFAPRDGLLGAYEQAASMRFFDYRPVVSLVFATTHELLGTAVAAHLAIAAAVGVLVSLLLYCVLRTLGLEWPHAGVIAALALLYPFSDTTRLWAAGGINNLGVALYLGGVLVALRGLRARGRAAVALHAAAAALYVLSVLTYQVAAAAAMLSVLVYLLCAPWRAAWPRWAIDVSATAAATAVVAINAPRRIQAPGAQVEHALEIAREALSLLWLSALPSASPRPVVAVLLALALAGVALAVALRRPPGHPLRIQLLRWLCVAALATAIGIVAGYAIIAPANPFFAPLTPGTANRINGVPGIGFVVLVYALAMLAGTLALGARRRAALPAIVLSAALALGYWGLLREHEAAWADSWRLQQRVLAAVERGLGTSRTGATAYTFGHPIDAAPGIAVFRQLDLDPAAKVALGDRSVSAWPMLPGTTFDCGATRLGPTNNRYGPANAAAYGRAVFIDVASGRSQRIDSRRSCQLAVRSFRPGPLLP